MPKFIDLSGQKFGDLTVISRAENGKSSGARWNCLCKCGRVHATKSWNLTKGRSTKCKSCSETTGTGVVLEMRRNLQMTQKEYAAHSGISVNAIHQAEKRGRFLVKEKTQIMANKAVKDNLKLRQERTLFKKIGIKRPQNFRAFAKNCARCGDLCYQRYSDAKQINPENPELANAFCNKKHALLFRWHGAEQKTATSTELSPAVVAQFAPRPRIRRQKRDLSIGLTKALKKEQKTS